MNKSADKIIRKTINLTRSAIKKFKKFSYELDDYDEDYDENFDESYDDYFLEDEFKDVITEQKEKLEDLSVDLHSFLEDYSGTYEYELEQAQMSIDSACAELDEILANFYPWNCSSDCNVEIVNTVEYLEEVLEALES